MMQDYDWNKSYKDGGCYIPGRMMFGIERYVMHGQVPGDFLQAVIRNDLKAAVAHADEENIRNLPAYVRFFYNEMPGGCWGTPKLVTEWVEAGGWYGKFPHGKIPKFPKKKEKG